MDVDHKGNLDDAIYNMLVQRVQARFLDTTREGDLPIFRTDVADHLFSIYLSGFDDRSRQYHNCHACQSFIRRYGSLVVIEADGCLTSALWNPEDAPEMYRESFSRMKIHIENATVRGLFLSSVRAWGQGLTGEWSHFEIIPPESIVFNHRLKAAHEIVAQKTEDRKNVQRALEEFSPEIIELALTLLQTESLYRSERVIAPIKWLSRLQKAFSLAQGQARENILWRAVATAPPGFCHPRSSVTGSLLEDLALRIPFDIVAKRFAEKMRPDSYQRPQADPKPGNVQQAVKNLQKLNAEGSLDRRFARLEEIQTCWKPDEASHSFQQSQLTVPCQVITWEKFARMVLPKAKRIEVAVPGRGPFAALLTAVNPDAPPIIQWDQEERRNPVSWYLYQNFSYAEQWGLIAQSWVEVTGIALQPNQWYGQFSQYGEGAFLLLRGARDSKLSGIGLFPEILKSEFHEIRSSIESYSSETQPEGREEATACGLKITKGQPGHILLRATNNYQHWIEYNIDRWD